MTEEIELGYRTLKWLETLELNQIPENTLPHMRNIVANIVDFQRGFSLPYNYEENDQKNVKLLKISLPYKTLVRFGVAYPVDSSSIATTATEQDGYIFESSTHEVACIVGSKAWNLEVEAGRITGKDAVLPVLESFEWIQNLFAILVSENLSDTQKKEARSLGAIWYYIATLISFDGEKGENLSKSKIMEVINNTFKSQKSLYILKKRRLQKLNDIRHNQDSTQKEEIYKTEEAEVEKRTKNFVKRKHNSRHTNYIEESASNDKEEVDWAQSHEKYNLIGKIQKIKQNGRRVDDTFDTKNYIEIEKRRTFTLSDSGEAKLNKSKYKYLHLSKGSHIGDGDDVINSTKTENDDYTAEEDDDYTDEEDDDYIGEENENYIDEEHENYTNVDDENYIDEEDEDYVDEDAEDYVDEDIEDYVDEEDEDYIDENYIDEEGVEYLTEESYEIFQGEENGKSYVDRESGHQKITKSFETDKSNNKLSEDMRFKRFREFVLGCVEKLGAQLPSTEDKVWLERTLKMMSIAENDELAWYPWGISPLSPLKKSAKSEDKIEREHATKLLSTLKITGYESPDKERQI